MNDLLQKLLSVKLVGDYKDAWKWYSMHVSIIMDALNVSIIVVQWMNEAMPSKYLAGTMLVLSLLLKIGRVIDQPATATPAAPK
jgi:hypothetical protein